MSIWDLDALRDAWIREELFGASHHAANHDAEPLEAAAFLAAYMARLLGRVFETSSNNSRGVGEDDDGEEWITADPILREYLSILPASVEDFRFHPVLWPEEELELLGTYSSTYDQVMGQRRRIANEYEAFSNVSSKFSSQISLSEYQVARLLVMTRSFGTGPLQSNEAVGHVPLEEELAYYKSTAGVDLSKGSHAMVPVLDLYDHHAKPNVGFAYDADVRSFVVTAIAAIPSGRELFDSYGRRTDSDLFAKYGFVNGDGSDYTEASLALWHKLEADSKDPATEKLLLKQMLRYLQYDDGYGTCVLKKGADSDDEEAYKAWVLKGLKYQYLLVHAHESNRWVVHMPPRNPHSAPALSSNIPASMKPPEFDMQALHFDGRHIFSTCRLISLTHWDYNGAAVELLQTNLHNSSYYLPPTRDALEFRTLMCVARMAQTALAKFGATVVEQLDRVSTMHNNDAFQSRNWTIAHLRLGEMQTLEALKQTAFAGLRPFRDQIDSEPPFTMRNEPCPPQILHPLLDDYLKAKQQAAATP